MKTWKKIKWDNAIDQGIGFLTIAKYRRDCTQDQIDEIIEALFEVSERKYVDKEYSDHFKVRLDRVSKEKNELIERVKSVQRIAVNETNEKVNLNRRIEKFEREISLLLTENEQLSAQIKALQQICNELVNHHKRMEFAGLPVLPIPELKK